MVDEEWGACRGGGGSGCVVTPFPGVDGIGVGVGVDVACALFDAPVSPLAVPFS